jgi:hypothetical protein
METLGLYEQLCKYTASIQVGKALAELKALKQKYPWVKCDGTLQVLESLEKDFPKLMNIVKLQEKRAFISKKMFEASALADVASREFMKAHPDLEIIIQPKND